MYNRTDNNKMHTNRILDTGAAADASARTPWLAGLALLSLVSLSLTFVHLGGRTDARQASWLANGTSDMSAPLPAPAAGSVDAGQQALVGQSQLPVFQDWLKYRKALQSYFAHAAELPADERSRQAEALGQQLTRYENEQAVAEPEALSTRLALLQASISDPQTLRQRSNALIEHYKAARQQRIATATH